MAILTPLAVIDAFVTSKRRGLPIPSQNTLLGAIVTWLVTLLIIVYMFFYDALHAVIGLRVGWILLIISGILCLFFTVHLMFITQRKP